MCERVSSSLVGICETAAALACVYINSPPVSASPSSSVSASTASVSLRDKISTLKLFGTKEGQRGEDERSLSKSSHNPLLPHSLAVIPNQIWRDNRPASGYYKLLLFFFLFFWPVSDAILQISPAAAPPTRSLMFTESQTEVFLTLRVVRLLAVGF